LRGRRYFVVVATATQIDNVRVVGILQNANEISLVETLAVPAEQLTRGNARLAGADRSTAISADRAANQVESFLATQA
jgi:hypothetical protein